MKLVADKKAQKNPFRLDRQNRYLVLCLCVLRPWF